ncbi:MAG: multicopper oxidase domain-containing protein [Saprospiraceae bacterium]|nr:multicopper oxidase domain-containing protein [Saprospiraceae bacterium]
MITVTPTIGQTFIQIPVTLSGNTIELTLQHGSKSIIPGIETQTIGYNGAFLGPTILLQQGQQVTFNVHNQLGDTTTTHWHGLHVAPTNDGSPHNPILAGETWSPSFTIMDKAATYWYHPHLHGKTLDQVVKGASGFIIVRDPEEAALNLPRTYAVDDVPLVFQWKTFDANNQIVENDEADNTVLVNGSLNGLLELPAQIVRLRLLNGSSHRYFDFGFSDNHLFKQIASDGGLLDAPVSMTRLILGPGERAEILVDLSGLQGNMVKLRQFGTQLPSGYPGGSMMMGGMMGPKDNTDFDLMTIQVTAQTVNAVTTFPTTLTTNVAWPQTGAMTRNFGLSAQPMMSMTNFFINGLKFDMETVNFTTEQGKTEIWNITNQTMMAHPFHVHGNSFYVLSVNGSTPPSNLRGRKDVVTIPPMNGSVKIIMRFEDFSDTEMPYMYHCHILSHEDTGMMGQFVVGPSSTGTVAPIAQNHLSVFPTLLTTGMDNIRITAESGWEVQKIEVYDQVGRMLLSALNITEIGSDKLVSGVNFIKVFTTKGTAVFTVIKTN